MASNHHKHRQKYIYIHPFYCQVNIPSAEMVIKVVPPEGKIELTEKLKPICESSPPYKSYYAVTRAEVDIKPWKDMLNSLPDGFWQDENQVGNVKLIRPAHDAWGIQKIMFTFCDDFLQKVLDLPYSQSPEWRPLLMSVYKAMGIDENKVVRSLLARMPAGVKIPVHHDTGFWVQHTHRCHLAIETGDEVEFWIGPTPNLMSQVRSFLSDFKS
jgi:hypothetical protein